MSEIEKMEARIAALEAEIAFLREDIWWKLSAIQRGSEAFFKTFNKAVAPKKRNKVGNSKSKPAVPHLELSNEAIENIGERDGT